MRFTETQMVADPDAAWALLADFGNIAAWNTGITASRIIAGPATGLGAERQCDFGGGGGCLREQVVAWDEDARTFSIDFTHFPAPLRARATFAVADNHVRVDYWYQGKGAMRPVAWLMHPMLRRAMRGVLRDLAQAATAARQASTTSPHVLL